MKKKNKIQTNEKGELQCSKCGAWKPPEEFSRDRKNEERRLGRAYWCKKCSLKYNKKREQEPNETLLEIIKQILFPNAKNIRFKERQKQVEGEYSGKEVRKDIDNLLDRYIEYTQEFHRGKPLLTISVDQLAKT